MGDHGQQASWSVSSYKGLLVKSLLLYSVLVTTMPNIKLTYFNLRGRAEPSRLLLAYAGKQYEDNRITPFWEDPAPWTALKPTTPWGTMPLLEYDGVVIGQSMAVARFLAKEFDLAGKGNLEQAQADEIVDVLVDIINKGVSLHFAKDEEGMKKHAEVTVPAALANIERCWCLEEVTTWW